MIWMRADGNPEIGIGHIMRCVSIADEIKQMGEEVCFILADECASELLQQKGYRYIVLHTAYDCMESEIDVLKQLIEQHKPDLLVVDSYSVTKHYFEEINDIVKTAYMDDLGDNSYPVNILINYNVYATDEMYGQAKDCVGRFLLGAQYAPLRDEFRTNGCAVAKDVRNVFISTGGSDKYNLAGMMLDFFMQDEELKMLNYHVICGNFNVHEKELEQKANKFTNINLYKNVSNIAEIMKRCDLAISAAGSTLYELAALSIPSIIFSFADNQKKPTEAFGFCGAAVSVGHYEADDKGAFMRSMMKTIKKVCADYDERQEMAHNANRLVDGLGAGRIARAIVECK
ncbi:MAG: UDP-2,4-diacetamido-2,4,6-trideoxy-beta-L-altropyranose hydrolase [Lachnospiraceae bacterium]|nr:UDP-2,4-diacetamido-2,4,6-trideoxy-beta-L-altropyranose hydrolase [Lachnospiraceae bacterium]